MAAKSKPSSPLYCKLNCYFSSSLGSTPGPQWLCDVDDLWTVPSVPIKRSCIAAKVARVSDRNGVIHQVARLNINLCSNRKPFICAGYFGADTFELIQGNAD